MLGLLLTDHSYAATGCGPAEPTPHTLTAAATRRRETHYLESLVAQATSRGAPVPARWTPCTWSAGSRRSAVPMERLRGDALGSAAGITVDGATVAADGSFTPGTVETGRLSRW